MDENPIYLIKYKGQTALYLQKTALFLIEPFGNVTVIDEKLAIETAEQELNEHGFVKEIKMSDKQRTGLESLVNLLQKLN